MGTLFVVVFALAIAIFGCAVVDPTKRVSSVPPSRAPAPKDHAETKNGELIREDQLSVHTSLAN